MDTWTCRLLQEAPTGPVVPGDMWFALHVHRLPLQEKQLLLSRHYFQHNLFRPPVIVALPDGSEWCVDTNWDWRENRPAPWKASGIPPLLTVTPMIELRGWRGWLVDGMLWPAGWPEHS